MLTNILELIYPTKCGVCNKLSKESLCKKCSLKMRQYEINQKNFYHKSNFDEIMCIYKYEGLIRQMFIKYKFNNAPYLYRTFTHNILKNKKICAFLKKYDIIIPVPVHKKRKLKRGYNQTELIAKEIANKLNLRIENNVLMKIKNNKPQSELLKIERINNVKDVFKIKNSQKISGKNIVVLDDIYTTGSTVNECSKMLKLAGASRIGVLTVAKD